MALLRNSAPQRGDTDALWLAGSVALTTAIGVVDAAFGAESILVGALVLGPLLAAARADAIVTACVAVYALLLALLVGIPNDVFGSGEHFLRCLPVAVGGALAVWIAALRQGADDAIRDLAFSRDQLDVILQGVADGVTAQGPDGLLLFANEAAAKASGFASPETMLATPPAEILERYELLDEHGRPFPLSQLPGRLALAGSPAQATIRYRDRRTGEERWTVVKAQPVPLAGGTPTMAINIIEDVTLSKRAERAERFLSEASQVLSDSLEYDRTLRAVAELAVPEYAEWCGVELVNEDGGTRQVAVAHAEPEKVALAWALRERYPPDPNEPTGVPEVIRSGVGQLYEEVPQELIEQGARDAEHLEIIRRLDLHSVVIVPLSVRGRTLGAMTLVRGTGQPPFDGEDLALAGNIATRAATAVDNARLFRASTETSRALQDSLLPPVLPDIPGLEVASRFRAAGEGNEVGGDFYDLFEVSPGSWVLVVGDVVGKGAEAAAVTGLARYTVRAAAMTSPEPRALLASLNEAMLRQRGEAEFCTVVAARFTPAGHGQVRLQVASAGHPLPVLVCPGEPPRFFGGTGTLMGVVDDPALPEEEILLDPGATMVLYTDGVTEARAPEHVLSPDELLAAVGEARHLDPAALAERVERLAAGADSVLRDDLAILAARVTRPLDLEAELLSPPETTRGRP